MGNNKKYDVIIKKCRENGQEEIYFYTTNGIKMITRYSCVAIETVVFIVTHTHTHIIY